MYNISTAVGYTTTHGYSQGAEAYFASSPQWARDRYYAQSDFAYEAHKFVNTVAVGWAFSKLGQATTPAAAQSGTVSQTLKRIRSGGSYPHRNDGAVFKNYEGRLPSRHAGYYREYVHPTPGIKGPGPQRVIIGGNGEVYFSPDHYKTFQLIE